MAGGGRLPPDSHQRGSQSHAAGKTLQLLSAHMYYIVTVKIFFDVEYSMPLINNMIYNHSHNQTALLYDPLTITGVHLRKEGSA